jgi:hypothetical protein
VPPASANETTPTDSRPLLEGRIKVVKPARQAEQIQKPVSAQGQHRFARITQILNHYALKVHRLLLD